jgi:hypothetical protein
VSKASRAFDRYLEVTYGGANEAQRAFEIDERADHWTDKPVNTKSVKEATGEKKKKKNKKKESKEKKVTGVNCASFGEDDTPKKKTSKRSRKKQVSDSESSDVQQNGSSDSSTNSDDSDVENKDTD